jgi:hypothetical protein
MATAGLNLGAPLSQAACNKSFSTELWRWGFTDPRYGGTYDSLRNAYTGWCARPKPGSLDLALYECPGAFYVKHPVYGPESGWFQIYNREAGTCLAVDSYQVGTRVFEWWCIPGNNAEVWRAEWAQ